MVVPSTHPQPIADKSRELAGRCNDMYCGFSGIKIREVFLGNKTKKTLTYAICLQSVAIPIDCWVSSELPKKINRISRLKFLHPVVLTSIIYAIIL